MPCNVHAGENVRLQNAYHKQTDSYLSLKVSLKNRRLHKKGKAVSDVCRMKQYKGYGLALRPQPKSHRSPTPHLHRHIETSHAGSLPLFPCRRLAFLLAAMWYNHLTNFVMEKRFGLVDVDRNGLHMYTAVHS